MTNPAKLDEPITGFYCGNDKSAKEVVCQILHDFGWTDTQDLGDISMSRYTEMLGAIWVPLYGQLGTMDWGLKLVKNLKYSLTKCRSICESPCCCFLTIFFSPIYGFFVICSS